jgi:hypothetical protein
MPSHRQMKNVISIASLAVAIASMAYACQSIQVDKQIAEASGSLDRATLEVAIGDHPITPGKEIFVFVGTPILATATVPAIGAIPFTFRSSGKKSLDYLLVSFQYYDIFRRDLLEKMDPVVSGPFSGDLRKTTSERDNRYFVSYSLPVLNPGVALVIGEPLFLEETQLRSAFPVTTKAGENLSIAYDTMYFKNFGLLVSARDSQVLGYPISVAVQKANSVDDIVRGQLRRHVKTKQEQLRKNLGFVPYLIALLSSSPSESAVLVYSNLRKVTNGEAVAYSPTDKPQVAIVQFSLLSWSLLIGNSK